MTKYAAVPLISESYRALNSNLHEGPLGFGNTGDRYAQEVAKHAVELGAKTILDYGCGKGALKPALRGLGIRGTIFEYDPAIRGKWKCPEHADLVVAAEVMEHIEPEYLMPVINHLYDVARMAVFMTISHRLAKKVLADGRNAHLIVKPPQWWMDRLGQRFTASRFDLGSQLDGSPIRSLLLLRPKTS